MKLNGRGVSVAIALAVGGVVAGGALTSCKSQDSATASEKHACRGMNKCAGKGGCSTGDKGCAGKNTCAAKGGCATAAKHGCAGKNECKGQGGCKSGDKGCAGKNTCSGKGGCAVPVKH